MEFAVSEEIMDLGTTRTLCTVILRSFFCLEVTTELQHSKCLDN